MMKKNDLDEGYGDEMDYKEEHEDELEVENYSPHELKSKKRAITTRVAVAGVVVWVSIGVAGLIISYHYSNESESGSDKNVGQINVELTVEERNIDFPPIGARYTDFPNVLGGSGSWFLSRMERFDG